MHGESGSGLGIENIKAPDLSPNDHADEWTQAELHNFKRKAALERKSFQQDIEERKRYAKEIFKLVSFWLMAVFWILIASGWQNGRFRLSDQVLIALLGGTTINVIGLFAIVAKYLFSNTSKSNGADQQAHRFPKHDP